MNVLNGGGQKYMMKYTAKWKVFLSVLLFYNPIEGERFYLQTAASNIAIGAHLYIIDRDGQKAVIGFIGCTLKEA